MPRYDYRCEAGHKYEKQEPFGSPSEHPCQKCGKPARRVPVAPPLVFKTGGYYKSAGRDFSSDSGSSSSSSSSKPAKPAGAAKKAPAKATKPAKKPAASPD